MKQKKIKVGFDLDGVILYNPIRIFRVLITNIIKPIIKTFFPKKKKNTKVFFVPQSSLLKFIWILLHKTSFMISPGYKELVKLSKSNKYEFYLITGRYGFLKKGYEKWLNKIQVSKVFKKCFYNSKSEQPHLFKEKMIKQLKLDIYVEDNYDIVTRLAKNKFIKILWITNLLDRNIPYQFKFFSLKEVCQYLKKLV